MVTIPIFGLKIFPALIGTLVLALVIAACGGSDPTRTANLSATVTPSPTPALTEEEVGRTAPAQSSGLGRSNIPEIIKALGPRWYTY